MMNLNDDKVNVFSRLQENISRVMKEHAQSVEQHTEIPFGEEIESTVATEKQTMRFPKRWLLGIKSLFTISRTKSAMTSGKNTESTHSSTYLDEYKNFSFSIDSKVISRKINRVTKKSDITTHHKIEIRIGDSSIYENKNDHNF
jgi:hypothetical protein